MHVVLPAVKLAEKAPSNNEIIHFLEPSTEVIVEVISITQSYILVANANIKICITCNEDRADSSSDLILLSTRRITEELLLQNRIYFKRWLKHPLLRNYSPEDVVHTWRHSFRAVEEDAENGIGGLRMPQVGAIYSVLSHLRIAEEAGIVVLPTGTGKTETMLSLLISHPCARLLVVVPSDALRTQIAEKFMTLGYLKRFGVVSANAINPRVGILNSRFKEDEQLTNFLSRCNVIISTMPLLSGNAEAHTRLIAESCTHLFVDEAHHSPAAGWDRFIAAFEKKRTVLFTATPFRNDGERLQGKIVFNFPLSKAQEHGYFKEISFRPIREYDSGKADERIAEAAISKLREDLQDGFNHILLARCGDIARAKEVFKLYIPHADLSPVLIYSTVPRKEEIVARIKNKEHRIIVCVDMLGEGFDLPELKIAAFHDIRKSLPITLQLAGRFTRTSRDRELGEATFIANLYQPDVKEELEELYAQDADWNALLPGLSGRNIQDQVEFEEFIKGFRHLSESFIPFQNIRPPLSTVVYKNMTDTWAPRNFADGIPNFESYDHKFSDLNSDQKTLVILLGKKVAVDWGNFSEVFDVEWSIFIVYWETHNNLLFIHGSDKTGQYQALAKAILGETPLLISGKNVFRVFYNIDRLALFNVGLRKGLGKNLSFQSFYGRSVGEAISLLQRRQGIKNNIFGVGFENGEKVSIGGSQKGRIWSYLRGNIRDFTLWCKAIGDKLVDDDIDPDAVLEGTLVPKIVSERPIAFPITIDWDAEMYRYNEDRFEFVVGVRSLNLAECELQLLNPSTDQPLIFSLVGDEIRINFRLDFLRSIVNNEVHNEYRVQQISEEEVSVRYGAKLVTAEEFFMDFTPVIWFANGGSLRGNLLIEIGEHITQFPGEKIIALDWNEVDLTAESQHVEPKIPNSIQGFMIEYLKEQDFDVIYDDDYSGEIADVVAIKDNHEEIVVDLFHLKWAVDGVVSNRIKNLYEVCGQAQKSANWKFRQPKEFFNHLLRRKTKKRGQHSCSRLEKGTLDDLERLLRQSRHSKPLLFNMNIVQPAVSKSRASDEILTLLGVTQNYLQEVANIELTVYGSD